jgi:hypothetical protein
MTYKGSFTVAWTGPDGTGSSLLPTGRNIRFNAVKLEQVSAWDPMSGPPIQSSVFVICPQIVTNVVDIFNGVEKAALGGAQFTGGAFLNISKTLAPIKYSSNQTDVIRGEVSVIVIRPDGTVITGLPATTNWSVTISMWDN